MVVDSRGTLSVLNNKQSHTRLNKYTPLVKIKVIHCTALQPAFSSETAIRTTTHRQLDRKTCTKNKMQFTTFLVGVVSSLAFAQTTLAQVPTHIGVQCTTVITAVNPVGCVMTAAAATSTSTIDCAGCVIKTSLGANGFFGHGPVCFGGRKTVTDASATAIVHACSPNVAAADPPAETGYVR